MSELHIKLGALLRLERERQSLDLEDVAANLNMASSTLEAIEEGDPSGSPSELYFELFTKSYSQLLGIDYAATVEAIKEEIGPETPPPPLDKSETLPSGSKPEAAPEEAAEEEKSDDSHLVKKLLYLVAVIIVIFIVFLVLTKWVFSSDDHNDSEPTVDETEMNHDADLAAGETASSAAAGYDWDVPEYVPDAGFELVLKPHNESWSTVLADGDTVVYRTLYPGRTYDVSAKYRLSVSIGIPSAVDVFLNGREVNLRNPETGRIHGIHVDRLNVDEIYARELPQKRGRSRTAPTESTADVQTEAAGDTAAQNE